MIFRRTKYAAGVVLCLLVTVAAQQSSKPDDPQHACDEAKNQMALNQCAGEQYHKADSRLNTVYRKALDFMQRDLSNARERQDAKQVEYEEAAIQKLKAAEKIWIQYRDLHCDAAKQQYEGGSMSPMIWGFCMAETTLNRIQELKSAYEDGDRKLE